MKTKTKVRKKENLNKKKNKKISCHVNTNHGTRALRVFGLAMQLNLIRRSKQSFMSTSRFTTAHVTNVYIYI